LLTIGTDRIELGFILLFRYLRQIRSQQLAKAAAFAAEKAKSAAPVLVK